MGVLLKCCIPLLATDGEQLAGAFIDRGVHQGSVLGPSIFWQVM